MSEFDQKAAGWDANPMRVERAAAVAGAIRKHIPLSPTMSAFEYGCGTGLVSFALQDQFSQITLADNSRGMLAVLGEKIGAAGLNHMHPLLLDLSSAPPPAQPFDLIYTLLTLHHIPEIRPILAAFYAMLNPGGWVALADLDLEDGSFHEEPFSGHFGFARAELQTLLTDLGFRRIHFETVYRMTKIRDGQPHVYDLFLAAACKELK